MRPLRPAPCTWRGAAVRLGAPRAFWRHSSVGFGFVFGLFSFVRGTREGAEKRARCVFTKKLLMHLH